MSRTIAAALMTLVLGASTAGACQLEVVGTPPTWEQKIDWSNTIFVGRVVRLKPNSGIGSADAKVVFRVERKLRGTLGHYYEALQGSGGDCGIPFAVGDRVIFAGEAIWDPTIVLSDPLTAEQDIPLKYVEKIGASR